MSIRTRAATAIAALGLAATLAACSSSTNVAGSGSTTPPPASSAPASSTGVDLKLDTQLSGLSSQLGSVDSDTSATSQELSANEDGEVR